ncbi:hypothetical protein TNCV_122041 [Trichonephila clavipes]|nr:hypothetical protein TNCV_122041 [Trichonephila clavipes]
MAVLQLLSSLVSFTQPQKPEFQRELLPEDFMGAVGPDFIVIDGKVRPHEAYLVGELLESEDICWMNWPARSPDIIPIKHV